MGEGAQRYLTVPTDRTVLVVARTVTTTAWLLDVLADVLVDWRVQLVFTVEDVSPSVYHRGVRDLLASIGAPTIPWDQATDTTFDLAICSSFNGSFESLRAPLLITLHGPGIGKHASVLPGGRIPLPEQLLKYHPSYEGPATTVVLPHTEQKKFLKQDASEVAVVIAGDPCFDRLRMSSPRRDGYRAALAVHQSQRLLVLSSTWGEGAQMHTYPDLSLRFANELPCDEWRVAMVIHPNIWFGHGKWQIRLWLRQATNAGVLLIAPEDDAWQAAILAADVVVADHGSVGLYAAALGRPVLTAAFDQDQVIPSVPLAELGRRARALEIDSSLRDQVDRALAEHRPDRFADLAERISGAPGRSRSIIRDALYDLLRLPVPLEPPLERAIPFPVPEFAALDAHIVFAAPSREAHGTDVVAIRRFPVHGGAHAPRTDCVRHLVVDSQTNVPALLASASIITRSVNSYSDTSEQAWAWSRGVLREYPECSYAAQIDSGRQVVVVFRRDRVPLEVSSLSEPTTKNDFALAVAASAVYALEVTNRLSSNGQSLIARVGDLELSFQVDVHRD